MKYYGNLPLGTYGWANNDTGIFGGWRADGFHPAGHLVAHFAVYDIEHKKNTGEDKPVGKLRMLVKLPTTDDAPVTMVSLIELEIDKAYRRMGYGRRAVECIREAAPDGVKIVDIQKSKLGFWKAVGVEDIIKDSRTISGVLRKAVEPTPSPGL